MRKGDIIRYTGPYEPEVEDNPYPPGVVERISRVRQVVTVKLIGEGESWADWPVDETEPVEMP